MPQPLDPASVFKQPTDSNQEFLDFTDSDQQRQAVFDAVRSAYAGRTVEDKDHVFEFADVDYRRQPAYTLQDEKDAILKRKRLYWPLAGRMRLRNKETGEIVSEDEKPRTLAHVPYMSSLGTFIHGGNQYVVANQQRLKSGIYKRTKDNGDVEGQFNVIPGTGRGFRVHLEPQSGLFRMQVGQSTIKLYPFLKDMGITDKQLESSWGRELLNVNRLADDKEDNRVSTRKVLDKLGRTSDKAEVRTHDDARKALATVMERMKLDPEVTARTMGKPYDHVTPDSILDTSAKLLGMSRGEVQGDERDSLAFQSFHSADDFFREHVEKDAGQLLRQAMWKARNRGTAGVPNNFFSKQLNSVLLGAGVAAPSSEINPVEVYDLRHKITRMGEGGIGSTDAVSKDARGVQPTHFGFIDPIRSPECYSADTEVWTVEGWKYWTEVDESTLFACLVDDRIEYNKASNLFVGDYEGPMYGAKTAMVDYLVTPNHRMWVRPKDKGLKYRVESPEKVSKSVRLLRSAGFKPFVAVEEVTEFVLPTIKKENATKLVTDPIDITDWCAFLGWYLTEGCTAGLYVTMITQVETANPENVAELKSLLDRLPFTYSYTGKDFSICGKQLRDYVKQFGLCNDKFIPDYVFNAPVEARKAFVHAALLGDGRANQHLCTTSKRFAYGFHKLLLELGISSKVLFEADDREERYLGCYIVYQHTRDEREVTKRHPRTKQSVFHTQPYTGKVYCAEVPGSLLYVRRNGSVGFWCGNSLKIGLDMRIASGVKKGKDGKLYQEMLDRTTGLKRMVAADEVFDTAISLGEEMAKPGKKVRAMVGGKMRYVPKKDVRFVLPSSGQLFTPGSNVVPIMGGIKAQRALMGARMTSQALPLEAPDEPLVQTQAPNSMDGMEKSLSRAMGAKYSDQPGVVTKVEPGSITIRQADGQNKKIDLYNNYPLNQKTRLHNTPVVKVGDTVEAGQLIAPSNFTGKTGDLALGKNVSVAYHMMEGMTHEDAVVVSESAAKKFSSEQMYKTRLEKDDRIKDISKSQYTAKYPGRFTKEQLANIDKNGVALPGTELNYGDPIMLAVGHATKKLRGSLTKGQKSQFSDQAQVWEHETPGVVQDVEDTGKGWNVSVKTYTPAKVGDKLSGRYGDKGVIAKVVPDDEMPSNASGPIDVVLNPMGVISRVNPSQLVEASLGKVAEKTGQKFILPNFNAEDESWAEYALDQLKQHKLSDTEDLEDPKTGNKIPGVMTGIRHFLKLHHMAESKFNARSQGFYTMDGQPAKGGKEGAKRIGYLETFSLLSHGATDVLKDSKLTRGQRNDDYWQLWRTGVRPPAPKVSSAYEKFEATLRGAGVHLRKEGPKTQVMPMTDDQVRHMAEGRELTVADTVDFDSMEPVKGGLFDVGLTGGADGKKWSFIKLQEPMPNPIMEDPIKAMLQVTGPQFESILSGEKKLGEKSGGKAIEHALSQLDVDREIETAKQEIKTGRKSKRNSAVKRLRTFESLKRMGIQPKDLMMTMAPVLPPKFRALSKMDETQLVADANFLYKDLMEANDNVRQYRETFGQAGETNLDLYKSFKAVTGLGNPISVENQERGVKGLLKQVFGSSPKSGMFQRKVIGTPVDQVGRAVISPDPDLDIDEVGLPVDAGWQLYKQYIIRDMVKSGMRPSDAFKAWKERDKRASSSMDRVLADRPIFINRAPSLHKFNLTAHKPKLVSGHALRMPIAILGGHGADFDGDAMNFHVPHSEKAVNEAKEKMMPSKMLIDPRSFSVSMTPPQGYVTGLFLASTAKSNKMPKAFKTRKEMMQAYKRGELDVDDEVVILEK